MCPYIYIYIYVCVCSLWQEAKRKKKGSQLTLQPGRGIEKRAGEATGKREPVWPSGKALGW